MRETILTICERDFILKTINDGKRLDGRQPYDFRKIKIVFGVDRGCCQVQIGETRVLAQVSCELTEPKPTRPSDGILFTNVELSPMACPSFEVGRLSEFGVEINRLLERCIKESRCVDTESLCIIAGEKVWTIRVDVHILNHAGNIMDCVSIAAISSLAHFRRPEVSVSGSEITVHSMEEKDPIPLSVRHMPICISFGFYEQGKFLLVDPAEKEEKVMDGKMVIGMNKHREICTLLMTGEMLLLKDQVLRCSNIAVVKVTEISELIQKAIENDTKARLSGHKFGFAESVDIDKITVNQKDQEMVDLSDIDDKVQDVLVQNSDVIDLSDDEDVIILDKGTGAIGHGGPSTWDMEEDDLKVTGQEKNSQKGLFGIAPSSKQSAGGDLDDDSEEEVTRILGHGDLEMTDKKNLSSVKTAKQTQNKSQGKKGKKKMKSGI